MQDSLPAGGLRLYREGVEPSGSLRKVSGYISVLLSRTSPVARVVYAKRPFAGPEAVLAYLSRYTHRVAISNRRLVALNHNGVTFRWKDYRAKGRARYKRMTLAADEFIRRFLLHVLPTGFHRIRHYGLFANGGRAENLARARKLLGQPPPQDQLEPVTETDQPTPLAQPCPCCGGPMIVIETFEPGHTPWHHAPRAPPAGKAASPPPSHLRAA
jgi:hypothetical protein